jgi:hypothetical protein
MEKSDSAIFVKTITRWLSTGFGLYMVYWYLYLCFQTFFAGFLSFDISGHLYRLPTPYDSPIFAGVLVFLSIGVLMALAAGPVLMSLAVGLRLALSYLLLSVAVEPAPSGSHTIFQFGFRGDLKDRVKTMLNHSIAYQSPEIISAITDWITHVVPSETAKPEAIVVILPFGDARRADAMVGTRKHFWGKESPLEISHHTVEKAMADYLEANGWFVVFANSLSDAMKLPTEPDVILTGKVLELSASAQRKLVKTEIRINTAIEIEMKNRIDESTIRSTQRHSGFGKVYWFEPEDIKEFVNEALAESLDKGLKGIIFKNRCALFS